MKKVKRDYIVKVFLIFVQVGILYIVSMIGDIFVGALKIPIPGSIVGLLLLFICLHFNIIREAYIKDGAGFMLVVLPLFLIPSTVGVVQYPTLFSLKGLLLIVLVMGSTFITMIVAGRISQSYEIRKRKVEG